MPERKRKKREAERDKLQRLMENLPEHVKQRMENPSSQSLMLSEALKSRLYNGGIYSISSEGDVERITQDPDLGANANRQETRIKRALELRDAYSDIWSLPKAASVIARKEPETERTIRRYKKDFP